MKKLIALLWRRPSGRLLIGMAILSMAAGCAGYVGYAGPDYGYWGPGYDYDWGGDVYVFGGDRDHFHHDYGHDFARRGASSRATGGFHGGGVHGGGVEHR